MDALNHLLFGVLSVTPAGFSPYRLTAKMLAGYATAVCVSYVALGLSMNFIRMTDVVAYLMLFYVAYLAWVRKQPLSNLFMFSVTTVAIAGASHGADRALGMLMQIPPADSPLRPHNLWHSPIFALGLSALATLAIPRLMNLVSGFSSKKSRVELREFPPADIRLLAATYLGYLVHIFADALTYDFDVWWLFPFSDVHFSLYDLANSGRLLALDANNPWGWAFYQLTPALIVCTSVFAGLCYLARG